MTTSLSNMSAILKKVNIQAISPKQGSLLIIVILALLGGIAWITIIDKEQYLVQRNFRVLDLWSQDIHAKIASYKKGVEFAAEGHTWNGNLHLHKEDKSYGSRTRIFSTKHEEIHKQDSSPINALLQDPRTPLEKSGTSSSNTHKADLTAENTTTTKLDPSLEDFPHFMKCSLATPKAIPSSYVFLKKQLCAFKDVADITFASPPRKENIPPLTDKPLDSPTIQVRYTKKFKDNDKQIEITGNVKLGNFLTRLTNESPFEEALVFQSSPEGRSTRIFHAGSRGFSWNHVEDITQRSKPSSLISNMFSSKDDSPDEQTPRSLQNGPDHFLIEIPGNTYDVFSYPFTIDGEKKIDWVLVGLVSHDAFQRSYLTISSTILLGMVLLVLGVVLGIPLFHLQMMGPTDPLRSTHVLASALSALLGAALLTYLSLDIFLYQEVKHTLNEQMETSAQTMKNGFEEELKRVLHTLHAFDESNQLNEDINTVRPRSQPLASTAVGQRPVLLEKNMKSPCDRLNQKLANLCYPNFIYAFWMDEDASLRINWAREGYAGVDKNLSIKDRNYTKTVLEHPNELWRYPRRVDPINGDFRFFLESITSWNSGKNTVVASMPSRLGLHEQPWVAAMEFTFPSLMQDVVLPPGIGFAVLDNKNHQVLFHSEEDRNRGENFLVETDHNATLRDLFTARTAGHADGSYWGESTSFYVLPLDPVPWSLIVYRNKAMLRSINLMGILIAGTLYGLWSFVLYFIVWLQLKRLTSHQKSCWLWPTRTHHLSYSRLLKFNCALFSIGAIGLYILAGSPTRQLILALVVIPVIGLWGSLRIFRQKLPTEQSGESFRKCYAYSASSLLLIFAILPAFACYSSVGHLEMRLFTQFQLLEIFKRLQQSDKLQSVKQTETCPTISDSRSTDVRASNQRHRPSGFYPEFFLHTTLDICQEPITHTTTAFSLFDGFFSLLSQPFLPLLKHASLGGFLGETWPNQDNHHDQLDDKREITWAHSSTSTSLISTLPSRIVAQPSNISIPEISPTSPSTHSSSATYTVRMNAQHPFILSWPISRTLRIEQIVGYLLMAFIFLAWLIKIPTFIANKTVFLSYNTQSWFPMEALFLSQNFAQPNNRLILGFPGQGKTPMANHIQKSYGDTNHSRFLHFDLKTLPPDEWWIRLSEQLEQAKNDNIQHVYLIVDHLECQWKNPSCNVKKLEFLELLLQRHTSTLHSETTSDGKSKKLVIEVTDKHGSLHADNVSTKILPTTSS